MLTRKPGPAPRPAEQVQSTWLRARVTEAVAERFRAACRRRGTDPSSELRDLAMDFIIQTEKWRGK